MDTQHGASQGKSVVDPKHSGYYERNKEVLREKSRQQMAKLRAERRALTQAGSNINQGNTLISATPQNNTGVDLGFSSDESAAEDEGGRPVAFEKYISSPDSNESAAEDVDEGEGIRLTPFDEIDHFNAASDAINAWLAEWGGLEAWPGRLDSGYEAAKATGCVDHWIQKVLDHADRGRLLRNLLGQMETALPQELWKIRELWRQQTVLLGLVIRGLELIELRVDIIRGGPFNLVR
ncbi:hypothetical protein BDN72DRAFT_864527 [Pluteus cervinus]|uniref:Uncharacterized protein n=1 Tax=Pluteus cervinus TaxID=181527 RepID=A0ACD3A5X2_9AGAR|nr:hypothetical protein BDN72DRAFT_864527 [Pluteus cervinus]